MSDFFEEKFQRAVFAPVIKITKNTKKPVFVSDISQITNTAEKEKTEEKTEEKGAFFEAHNKVHKSTPCTVKSIPEVSGIGFFENSLKRLVRLAEKTGFEVSLERQQERENSFCYTVTVKKKTTKSKVDKKG